MHFFTSRIVKSAIELKIEEIMQKFDFNTAYITLHILYVSKVLSEEGRPLVPQPVPLLRLRDLARKLLLRTSVSEDGKLLSLACFSAIKNGEDIQLFFTTRSYNTASSKFEFGSGGTA